MTNEEIEKLLKIWRSNANYEGKRPPPYTLMSVQLNNACDIIEELLNEGEEKRDWMIRYMTS